MVTYTSKEFEILERLVSRRLEKDIKLKVNKDGSVDFDYSDPKAIMNGRMLPISGEPIYFSGHLTKENVNLILREGVEKEKEKLANEIMKPQIDRNITVLRVPYNECRYVEEARKDPERFHTLLLRYRPIVNSDIYSEPLDRLQKLHRVVNSLDYNYTVLWPSLTEDKQRLESKRKHKWLSKIIKNVKLRTRAREQIRKIDDSFVLPSELEGSDEFGYLDKLIIIPPVPEFGVSASQRLTTKVRERKIDAYWSDAAYPRANLAEYRSLIKEEDLRRQNELMDETLTEE